MIKNTAKNTLTLYNSFWQSPQHHHEHQEGHHHGVNGHKCNVHACLKMQQETRMLDI